MKTDTPSARSSRRSAGLHGLATLLLFGIIIAGVNYYGFKHYFHRDLSTSQFYTLSPKTVDVLKHLDSPVTVTTILAPQYREQIDNLLKEYERVGGKNFTFQDIDPAYDITKAADLQKRLQFDGNENLVIFEYKNRHEFVKQEDLFELNPITQQPGAFKGEQDFTAALVTLTEGKASKVYFTEGHGEHPIQDTQTAAGYGLIVQTLKKENIETASLSLAGKEVPADADALIIAGPAIPFSPLEVQAIDRYLSRNGKLFILLDPYVSLGMDDLLKRYSLRFDDDLVLYRAMTTTGQEMTVALALIYQGGFSAQPITTKLAQANLQLQITGARSITLLPGEKNGTAGKVQFLLQTDPNAWGWISKPGAPPPPDPHALTFNKATDIPGPVTIAAVYDGGTVTDAKTQLIVPSTRIVLAGCSKFLENDQAEQVGANFFTNSVDWLVKTKPVLDISPKIPQDYGVAISPLQSRTIMWTAMIVIPGIALVLALFTWLSRRK